jgi:hypothetical protein
VLIEDTQELLGGGVLSDFEIPMRDRSQPGRRDEYVRVFGMLSTPRAAVTHRPRERSGNVMSSARRWALGVAGFALLAAAVVARHLRHGTATPRATTPTALGTRLDSVSPQWATRTLGIVSTDRPAATARGPRRETFGVERSP